jgi:hypothetical protein
MAGNGTGTAHGEARGEAGYDAYFGQLEKDGVWGTVTFTLKRGRVTAIRYEQSYATITDALAGHAISEAEEAAQRT